MADIIINNKELNDIDLFVFDKDGTIIDLYTYWYNMLKLRAERICTFYNLPLRGHRDNLMFRMGIDARKRRLNPQGPVGLYPREVVQKEAENYLLQLNFDNVYDPCFHAFKEADELSLFSLDKFIKPVKGAIELLTCLKNRGCKTAIATSDKTERARICMECLKIEHLIDIIVGSDKVEKQKPAPDMLRLIGEAAGVPPLNSVMLGDSEFDVQMGINAEFKTSIALCSSFANERVMRGLTKFIITDLSRIQIK